MRPKSLQAELSGPRAIHFRTEPEPHRLKRDRKFPNLPKSRNSQQSGS